MMKGESGSAVKGLIAAAVIIFLVVTSPGWKDVLGLEGSIDSGAIILSLAVLVMLGWVIQGSK